MQFSFVGFAEIESFIVTDLPSDMTVYPQDYKLNCTKIGHNVYDISMSIGNTALASYTGCSDGNSNSPCPGTVLISRSNTIRYTLTITWDGMTVSNGSISQSNTGDQMYQCVLDNLYNIQDRIRTLTIKGNAECYSQTSGKHSCNCKYHLPISTSNCSLFPY